MKKFTLLSFIAAVILSTATSCSDTGNNTSTETFNRIEAGFKKPDSMQLAVYWYWISDNLSKEGVIKDLESMKPGINETGRHQSCVHRKHRP